MTDIRDDWLKVVRRREEIADRVELATRNMSRQRVIYCLLSYMSVADAEHVAKVLERE